MDNAIEMKDENLSISLSIPVDVFKNNADAPKVQWEQAIENENFYNGLVEKLVEDDNVTRVIEDKISEFDVMDAIDWSDAADNIESYLGSKPYIQEEIQSLLEDYVPGRGCGMADLAYNVIIDTIRYDIISYLRSEKSDEDGPDADERGQGQRNSAVNALHTLIHRVVSANVNAIVKEAVRDYMLDPINTTRLVNEISHAANDDKRAATSKTVSMLQIERVLDTMTNTLSYEMQSELKSALGYLMQENSANFKKDI